LLLREHEVLTRRRGPQMLNRSHPKQSHFDDMFSTNMSVSRQQLVVTVIHTIIITRRVKTQVQG